MRNKEMLLIPGPTPVADEIYDALASETYGHTDPRFVKIFKHGIDMTREMLKCDGEVFVVAGSGTLAMEMAIVNTVAPGEKLLVLSHGYFGDRFPLLARAFGIEVDVIQAEWGQHVCPKAVAERLANGGYKAVTVTHVDTSTGVIADVSALLPLVKQAGALFILDGVCATAGVDEDMSHDYGNGAKIDVVLTGSQKVIGVPPGLAIVAFSPAAMAAREAMPRVPAYYADVKNWLPIMRDPSKYFATPAVNMLYAYEKAMEMVMAEGLCNRFRRHAAYGKAVRAALAVYGMKALAASEATASPTLTCVIYPAGVDDAAFRKALAGKGMVIAGALAALAGKAFRIGHMGSTTPEMLSRAVTLIGETLREMGHTADVERAVGVFAETYKANA